MDWSNPAGSAVSGAFGLLGGYLNYKYNQKLTDQQNQYNLEMWNLQNEYNSPQAQMKRFEEAGLNPALIYSQGNPEIALFILHTKTKNPLLTGTSHAACAVAAGKLTKDRACTIHRSI